MTGESIAKTILVIDDEPAIRLVTKKMLEANGFRVYTAVDGIDGLSVFESRKNEIDLVISDMMMPNMEGASALLAISKVSADVVLIAASGFHPESIKEIADSAGVRFFLRKPFDSETLLTTIHSALAGIAA